MKITRQPWANPAPAAPPVPSRKLGALPNGVKEPRHPGPNATIGELFTYGQEMVAVQHLRVGFLEKGTRVLTRDGRRATVSNFVPYDGWNIGITIDGFPHEGVITNRNEIKVIK